MKYKISFERYGDLRCSCFYKFFTLNSVDYLETDTRNCSIAKN